LLDRDRFGGAVFISPKREETVRTKTLAGAALLTAAAACAGSSPPPANSLAADQSAAPVRMDRDVITTQELSGPSVSNMTVLEAVKNLRPHFLTVRGLNTVPAKDAQGNQIVDEESGKVHVSVDGNRIVGLDELSGIRAGTVAEVRYLNVAAAMQKFGGMAREGPVILVKTIK
jgi:hypothetical protein